MGRESAKIHSGRVVTPLGDKILCRNLDMLVGVTRVIIPDIAKGSVARFGVHRTGRPHAVGRVLAVGPKVKNGIKPGDYLLVDAMNSNPLKIDGKVYLFPRKIAVLCALDEEDVKKDGDEEHRR